MDKESKSRAYLAGVVFSVMVGFSFLGVKTCILYSDTLQLMTCRYDFAMLSVVIMMLVKRSSIDLRGKSKSNLFFTAFFYIAFMALQAIGLVFSTSIEGAIVFAIIPIFVKIIASIFLKEKSTATQNAFVCLSVGSLIFMIIMNAGEVSFNVLGMVLLMLSSLAMALNNVCMRAVRREYTPFEITAAICVLGFIGFNVASVVWYLHTGDMHHYIEPFMNGKFVIASAYLGVCCILFSAQLMAYMQANMPSMNASLFGNASTAFSIVVGAIVLGETLRAYHIICTILIVVGVIGVSVAGSRREKKLSDRSDG